MKTETGEGNMRQPFGIYCLLIVQILILAGNGFSHDVDCFESYLQQLNHVNNKFAGSLLACAEEDNENRLPTPTLDPEGERLKLEIRSQEICMDLTGCNRYKTSKDFFQCHSKTVSLHCLIFYYQSHKFNSILALPEQFQKKKRLLLIPYRFFF